MLIRNRKKKKDDREEIKERKEEVSEIKEEVEQSTNEAGSTDEIIEDKKENTKREIELYILCDRATNKFKKYIEESGINASKVYDSIEKLRDDLLLEYEEYRIVIIDTGTGKYSGVSQRKDIIDVLGIMDDECKASVFYTDEALKQEIQQTIGKNRKIELNKYMGTPDVILEIKRIGEKYAGRYKADINNSIERNLRSVVDESTDKFVYRSNLLATDEVVNGIRSSDIEAVKEYSDYI